MMQKKQQIVGSFFRVKIKLNNLCHVTLATHYAINGITVG